MIELKGTYYSRFTAISAAKSQSESAGAPIWFRYEGMFVVVCKDSDEDQLAEAIYLAMNNAEGEVPTVVGPYPGSTNKDPLRVSAEAIQPKGWRIVDLRRARKGEVILTNKPSEWQYSTSQYPKIILERVDQYRAPTDEDVGKIVQVRDEPGEEWLDRTLVAIIPGADFPYIAYSADRTITIDAYIEARVPITREGEDS